MAEWQRKNAPHRSDLSELSKMEIEGLRYRAKKEE